MQRESNLDIALRWLLGKNWRENPHGGAEGGFCVDQGGPTMRGVTQDTYNRYADEHKLPRADVIHIENDEIEEIYREYYWLEAGCDRLGPRSAVCLFDFAVNSGPETAVIHLQRVVKAREDGVFGPRTMALTQGFTDDTLSRLYLQDHLKFYEDLVSKNPRKYGKDQRGWEDRIKALSKFITTI